MKNDLKDIIAATADEKLLGTVLDYLHTHVCERMEPYESYSKRMTKGQRMVILMWGLSAEAANGGIQQYFSNSSGDEAEEALEYLRMIGAEKQAAAFEEISRQVFNGSIPSDRRKRWELLEAFEGNEEGMSEEAFEQSRRKAQTFYREMNKPFGWCHEIKLLATRYIRAHPEEYAHVERLTRRWWQRLW